MKQSKKYLINSSIDSIRNAARDMKCISGLTHRFYNYPARFSPTFARACIENFSKPGDIIFDPYMGGGTTIVEAMVLGRKSIGSDVNSLAVFVAGVKIARLSKNEIIKISHWAKDIVPTLRCSDIISSDHGKLDTLPKNMTTPNVKWLRKIISVCLTSIEEELPTEKSKRFAKCVLLKVGQWALNGRKRIPSANEFRTRIIDVTYDMLADMKALVETLGNKRSKIFNPLLCENDAESINQDTRIIENGPVDLVVTSPPYPGVHMLYHRWQVDGRKETDAPYWISDYTDRM